MADDIPTTEPYKITAGETVKWTKDLSDYKPDDGWTLKYFLVRSGSQKSITATDNGDGTHLVTIAATDSAGYDTGIYHWQARVEKGSEKYNVDSGTLEVLPEFAAKSSGYDDRTHVKKVLDAIEAVIEGRASKDEMGYTIAGRRLDRTPIADLLVLRDKYMGEYQNELIAERIANGDSSARKVKVRFT